jgi:hypothetical protein
MLRGQQIRLPLVSYWVAHVARPSIKAPSCPTRGSESESLAHPQSEPPQGTSRRSEDVILIALTAGRAKPHVDACLSELGSTGSLEKALRALGWLRRHKRTRSSLRRQKPCNTQQARLGGCVHGCHGGASASARARHWCADSGKGEDTERRSKTRHRCGRVNSRAMRHQNVRAR